MRDISGFGIKVRLLASRTFPSGFNVTQFADDSDPFDIPDLDIADKAMGLNGELLVWSTPKPIEVTLNVVPTSDDDVNLNVLFQANRVGKGKQPVRDIITMSAIYPDGQILTLTSGKIVGGSPAIGIQSSGRLKTRPYSFVFENYTNSQ